MYLITQLSAHNNPKRNSFRKCSWTLDSVRKKKRKEKKRKKLTVFYDSVSSARVILLLRACPHVALDNAVFCLAFKLFFEYKVSLELKQDWRSLVYSGRFNYICWNSPTLGLPPRFIDALFGVHITGISGWNLWCVTHYNTWIWLRSLQSTLPSKFKLDKK